MTAEQLIAAALAMPHTHAVVTTYECGKVRKFTTRNLPSAESHAIGERRKIGRELIERETGRKVRVMSVEVVAIQ